jgi:hypothetical protein
MDDHLSWPLKSHNSNSMIDGDPLSLLISSQKKHLGINTATSHEGFVVYCVCCRLKKGRCHRQNQDIQPKQMCIVLRWRVMRSSQAALPFTSYHECQLMKWRWKVSGLNCLFTWIRRYQASSEGVGTLMLEKGLHLQIFAAVCEK